MISKFPLICMAALAALFATPQRSQAQIFVGNLGDLTAGTGSIGVYLPSGDAVNSSLVTGLDNPLGIAVSGDRLFVTNLGGEGWVMEAFRNTRRQERS